MFLSYMAWELCQKHCLLKCFVWFVDYYEKYVSFRSRRSYFRNYIMSNMQIIGPRKAQVNSENRIFQLLAISYQCK